MKKHATAIDLPALLDKFLTPGTKAYVIILKSTEDEEEKGKEATSDLTDVAREIFQQNSYSNIFVTGGGSGGSGSPLTVQEG